MAQVKKKAVRKMAIVNVWQRTRKVCRRRFRLMLSGAQWMLEGVNFEYSILAVLLSAILAYPLLLWVRCELGEALLLW
jgi:hypothetical protein